MGDRANIHFIDQPKEGKGMFFYTHWSGEELPGVLKAALKRGKGRWDDNSYLARIIFCEMVRGEELGLTGYGLSTFETDNEHPHIKVWADEQRVTIGDCSWSFKEYIEKGPEKFSDLEEE